MEQLNNLMQKLNNDSLCAVSIYDKDKQKYVCNNLSSEKILEDFGSAEDYFESLYSQGHTNLTVQERRKNGNSTKNISNAFNVTFGTTESEKPVNEKTEKPQKKKENKLDVNEIIDLKIASIRSKELEKENLELKERLKRIKKKHKFLEREKLLNEFTVKKSDSFNNMLAGAIKQAPVIMAGLGIKVPIPAQGLGAVYDDGETSNFSSLKIDFLNMVKTIDDNNIQLLDTIHKKVVSNDDNGEFSNELVKLLHKHNMITA